MPPLFPQDALSAVRRGLDWRWLDVPLAVVDVACEPWALALLALALFSWLDREVRGVLKALLPLLVALAVAAGLALAARFAGAVPRPAAAARGAVVAVRGALASGHLTGAALFAVYAVLAYGRRGAAGLVLLLAAAAARAVAGPGWAVELAVGGAVGAGLAGAVYAGALRLFPEGHLARLRARRRADVGFGAATGGPGP